MEGKEVSVNMDDMSKFFEWFFITSIAVDKDGLSHVEFVNKVIDASEMDSNGKPTGTHKFRMFVNDIEVNPLEAISEIQKQFDRLVLDKANELINERIDSELGDVYQLLDELKRGIDIRVNRVIPKPE